MSRGAISQASYELAPIFVFFIAGQLVPFMTATLIFIAATIGSLLVAWYIHRHIPLMPLASALLTISAGAITVRYQQPDAIILADTVWYWGLAAAVAMGFILRKHFFEHIFDRTFAVQSIGWHKHACRWLVVLIIAGAANEYVRIMMTPEFWINYRFTKVILLTAFGLYQFTLARRYRIEDESNAWGVRTNVV